MQHMQFTPEHCFRRIEWFWNPFTFRTAPIEDKQQEQPPVVSNEKKNKQTKTKKLVFK